ncbi:MAG: hypothetical protein R6W06_09605 [Prochlorococcaceae cyanobacterium]
MTAASISEPLGGSTLLVSTSVLAAVAAVLLVFVSGGVIYLSTVEWRDRRRRHAQTQNQGKGVPASGAKKQPPKAASKAASKAFSKR